MASGQTEGDIELLEVSSGLCLRLLESRNSKVVDLTFSLDGKILASSTNSTIKLWDINSGKLIKTYSGLESPSYKISFSSESILLAQGFNNLLMAVDINGSGGFEKLDSEGFILNILNPCLSEDNRVRSIVPNKRLTIESSILKLSDVNARWKDKNLPSSSILSQRISFTQNGESMVIVGNPDKLVIWDLKTGRLRSVLRINAGEEFRYLSDSDTLTALSSLDEQSRLLDTISGASTHHWNWHSEKLSLQGVMEFNRRSKVALSTDGTLAAVHITSRYSFVREMIVIWDTRTGKNVRTLNLGNVESTVIKGMAFSPDNEFIATLNYEGRLDLWEINSGRKLRSVKLIGGRTLAFSPNGKFLVAGEYTWN